MKSFYIHKKIGGEEKTEAENIIKNIVSGGNKNGLKLETLKGKQVKLDDEKHNVNTARTDIKGRLLYVKDKERDMYAYEIMDDHKHSRITEKSLYREDFEEFEVDNLINNNPSSSLNDPNIKKNNNYKTQVAK